jgi:phosphatidylserine/phosphatidylglycerophosphate/cardiolipin synthase-like enzyme
MAVGVLALGMWVASCDNGGHGRHVFAQTAVYQSTMPLPSLVSAPGTFYSPETNLETLDVQALDAAHATVDFAAFSLTDQAIADELKALAGRGVRVRIYLDRGEVQSECRADVTCARIPLHALIGLAGVDIRVKRSKILMHLKSYEVDNFLVRDGSANFSIQGESRQDNSATFSSDGAALTRFSRKFQAMWDRPDNLTVAQAVGSQAAP